MQECLAGRSAGKVCWRVQAGLWGQCPSCQRPTPEDDSYTSSPGAQGGPVVWRVLTTTIWCCSWLQCLGRMGRMVGGSRMPSSMWITPLAASTSTLRSGTPSGPSRMRPCGRAQYASHPAQQAQARPAAPSSAAGRLREGPACPGLPPSSPQQHLELWQQRCSLRA